MATETEVLQCLALLTASYPEWQKNVEPEQVRKTYSAYVQFLSDLPGEALKEASMRHIKSAKFFPTIAELRERAFEIKRSYSFSGGEFDALPAPRPSVDERQRVRALVSDLADKIGRGKERGH